MFSFPLRAAPLLLVTASCVTPNAELEVDTTAEEVVGGRHENGYAAAGHLLSGFRPDTLTGPACGAALIAPTIAVTAAHCIDDPQSVYAVGFGDVYSSPPHLVSHVVMHPSYDGDPGRWERWRHDLAVLHLATPVLDVEPASIATPQLGCNSRYVGHGRVTEGTFIEEDGYTGERKSAGQCIDEIANQHLVTHGTDGGLCWGDSGGPLLQQGTNQILGVLADFDGIFSCYIGNSMIFTSLSGEHTFIDCAINRSSDSPAGRFSDTTCHWAEPFITALADSNIVAGYPEGAYAPDRALTRAELAALIAAAFDPAAKRDSRRFRDVAGHWAAGVIDVAYRGGFLSGYPDGSFRPDATLTRLEALVALASGLGLQDAPAELASFADAAAIPVWAQTKVAGAKTGGLIASYPDIGRLEPGAPATRADVAAFIYQSLVHLGRLPPLTNDYLIVE